MKNFLITLVLLISFQAYADVSITPIVGVERVQRFEPEEYTSNRVYYGVRLQYGQPIFSLEAEVTQSKDNKTFNNLDRKVADETTAAQLGFRSTVGQGPLNFFFRAGGSARQTEFTTTTISTGAETTEKPDIVINPYAGTGLGINVAGLFRLNAGITAIFGGSPKGEEIDYQATLGYTINFSSGGRR